jgi:lysophospholipase L1-like esterase
MKLLWLPLFALGIACHPVEPPATAHGAVPEPNPALASVAVGVDGPVPAQGADVPAPRDRDYPWMSLDEWWRKQRALAALDPELKRRSELAFLGDSITEGWDDAVWAENYARYRPVRLGLGGDKTEQVLYRIGHGELDGLGSRVVVVLIGTNNFGLGEATPSEVATGVTAVVRAVQEKLPKTRILLLGILPRDESPGTELREKLAATNALIQRLDAPPRVHYLDVGPHFLDPKGKIPKQLMADFLHPTPEGYRVLARALAPTLAKLLE